MPRGGVDKPLPAMLRHAQHDSPFSNVISPSESPDFITQHDKFVICFVPRNDEKEMSVKKPVS
jgi:hypothetical protein